MKVFTSLEEATRELLPASGPLGVKVAFGDSVYGFETAERLWNHYRNSPWFEVVAFRSCQVNPWKELEIAAQAILRAGREES